MATKKQLTAQASEALKNLVSNKVQESLESATKEMKAKKTKAPKKEEPKVEKKTVKAKKTVAKEVDQINKATLIEKVVSNREVKYIYPADVTDTLSRKSWRQKVRNKLKSLEMAMYRIKDQNSKEFAKAKKEYEVYYNSVCKPQAV